MFANKDYIMRLIEQFLQALLSIIRYREAGKHDEAFVQIQNASRLYLDADISSLLTDTPQELLDRFRKNDGTLDAERSIICADLIYEVAILNQRMPEVLLTLEDEKMYVETIFREKVGEEDFLYWYTVQGVGGAHVSESKHEIDQLHVEFSKECIDLDYSPQKIAPAVIMFGDAVRKALKGGI